MSLAALLLLVLPLHADIYERLDELPRHLRSGGVPRDGIPPIYDPKFVSVGEADGWIDDVEPVIALEVGGVARRIHCRY